MSPYLDLLSGLIYLLCCEEAEVGRFSPDDLRYIFPAGLVGKVGRGGGWTLEDDA
jgi:hypothetical protein